VAAGYREQQYVDIRYEVGYPEFVDAVNPLQDFRPIWCIGFRLFGHKLRKQRHPEISSGAIIIDP
jgi:hypothetical protein